MRVETERQVKDYGNRIKANDTLALNVYNWAQSQSLLDGNPFWDELVESLRWAAKYGGGTIDSIGLWIGYEKASREGYAQFGIDSLNDIIATEAGRLFAEELLKPTAAASGKQAWISLIQQKFADARSGFAQYVVQNMGGSRAKAQIILFNLLTTVNSDGTFKDRIVIPSGNYAGTTLWRATLGKAVDENRSKWHNDADRTAFRQALKTHLSNVANYRSPFTGPAGESLTSLQVETLSQMIEVLMFLEDVANP